MSSSDPRDLSQLSLEEKRRLLAEMLQHEKAAVAPRAGGYRFPPEYLELQRRFGNLETGEFGTIFFQVSEGLSDSRIRIAGRELINYCSYNYLGLCGDPAVSRAAHEAIDRYGTSVSASRLAAGERPFHRELEQALASFLGTEDSLVFVSGFGTNEDVIGHLMGPEDLVLHDSLVHCSVQLGGRLSGAAVRPFPHNSWSALEGILREERVRYDQVLIVLEGVYSMDGDIPALPEFVAVKQRHRALLMVDEAHSLGVLGARGRGIGEHHGVPAGDVDIWMGTLSKSLASCGGYIAGAQPLVEFLRTTAPGFVYSVGMPPPSAAAALAALRRLEEEPERVAQLQAHARTFGEQARALGFDTGASRDSAVIPLLLGETSHAIQLYRDLRGEGIHALPMGYPAVPEGAARIRFFLSSTHTAEQIEQTMEALSRLVSPRARGSSPA